MPRIPLLFVALTLGLLVPLSACKRREATEADCQLIVDRLVELELRATKNTDPAAIAKKQETIRATMKEEIKDCKGRRISDGMMNCVRNAATPDEILGCIR